MNLQVIILCVCQLLCWLNSAAFADPQRLMERIQEPSGVNACTVPDIIGSDVFAGTAVFKSTLPHNTIPGGLYQDRMAVNIFDADNIVPKIIVPLNSDIYRLRVVAGSRPMIPIVLHVLPPCLPFDATSFGKYASYHFSTTDFHKYLFRLKPF